MKLAGVLFVLAAMPAGATVPPEVPSSRSSQVLSPFFFGFGDDGEGVFTSGGPQCLAYQVTNDFRQRTAPVHGFPATSGLPQFLIELKSPTGLQFISSHGDVGLIFVEAFGLGLEGQNDATRQRDAYITGGQLQAGEGIVMDVNGNTTGAGTGYWGIWVGSAYINRNLGGTSASIFFNSSCRSASLASSFSGSGIRGYLGESAAALCPLATGDADHLFNTMSGIETISSQSPPYQNFPLQQSFTYANGFNSLLTFQPNSSSAGNIRLYNAPRIVFAQVTQDSAGNGSFSNVLYNYPPGASFAGSYPYGSGTADYPGAPGTSGFAKTGPILINLRFGSSRNSVHLYKHGTA